MIERSVLEEAADLFNRKQYFECHDVLEDAWSGARGEDRELLQALISVSVGFYHLAAGNHQGAKNLLERGVSGLESFLPEREGLDLLGLSRKAERCLEKTERALSGEAIAWAAEDLPEMRFTAVE